MGARLYTRGEVAALLGVSHSTVIRMEASGQLATVRVGSRSVRILGDSVSRHLAGEETPRDRAVPSPPSGDTSPDNQKAE